MKHYAFPTVGDFIEKHNRYSNWEARVAVDKYLGLRLQSRSIRENTWRRRLKVLSLQMPFRPFWRFFYVYVIQRGFLDGLEGYCFSCLHAFYEFLCVAKTDELRKSLKK